APPDRSPTVQVNIKHLLDDVQCYQTLRELRWPEGIACPTCASTQVIKPGFDDPEPARQRDECHACHTRFDDLTDTIFAGHHPPLQGVDFRPLLHGIALVQRPDCRRMGTE